jgi:hypothetical protein
MPLPAETIGGWTVTQFTKFLKNYLNSQPPRSMPGVVVGDMTLSGTLNASKATIIWPGVSDFTNVGSQGAPAFTNGWANWGNPYYPVGYWLDPFGFVHLRGTLKSGTVGQSAFTLPPGYRPEADAGPFIVFSNGGAGRVDVGADGTVTPNSPSNNTDVVLDGIYFRLT